MSSVFADGDPDLDASRSRSGILTPSSDASLNKKDNINSPALKKRREDAGAAMELLLKPLIVVKPHPHNLQIQPRTLSPLLLLPRQNLPLASIDFDSTKFDLPPSRFYESHIKILDLESRLGESRSLLIAKGEPRGNIYALERQSNGLYVICKLGSWVEIESLAQQATTVFRERVFPPKPEVAAQPASQSAITTPQTHKEQRKKRAAIEAIQSLVRKRAKSQSQAPQANSDESTGPAADGDAVKMDIDISPTSQVEEAKTPNAKLHGGAALPAIQSGPSPLPDLPPQDLATSIFDNIRTQYFEALYRSKGSLAYFAKGPLSRARSAFHLDLEANLDMSDLIEFLKGLLLTTVQIDKKYRETAPSIIAKLGKAIDSSDEARKKKRKAKKMKLGKDALYPLEDESVRKWWMTNKPELKDDDAAVSPAQIRSLLSLLRTRETQLQMIVILEILALEPLKAVEENDDSMLPTLPGTSEVAEEKGQTSQPKKRNKHNLPVLVDVHADRLTIWQSTATDELVLLEDSQANMVVNGPDAQQKASNEPLKDFCIDVIVPFFTARLPELCDSINRKLGGPVIVSPAQVKSDKKSSSKRDKPGMATKRPAPQNSQRTLQRALSTDQHHRRSVSRGPGNVIALMRSATTASVPGLKREGSEPVGLRAMAKSNLEASQAKRSGLSRSNSSANLEDPKAKRKALVEAQLQDAISGLRKPNREVIGKDIAEAAEQRHATGLAKKVKKVQRSSSTIQVKATPVNSRFKDVFGVKSESISDTPMRSLEEAIPPSSIGRYIPSTTARNPFKDAVAVSTSPAGPADVVGSTPTKPAMAASFLRRPSNDFIPPSPLFKTSKRDSMNEPPRSTGNTIFATPAKKSAPRPTTVAASPLPPPGQPAAGSIYEQLGWDDDLDDLL